MPTLVVLDASPSLLKPVHEGNNSLQRKDLLQRGVLHFLSLLPQKGRNDSISLATLTNGKLQVLVPFTRQVSSLKSRLYKININANASSELSPHMAQSLFSHLRAHQCQSAQIVLVTDGSCLVHLSDRTISYLQALCRAHTALIHLVHISPSPQSYSSPSSPPLTLPVGADLARRCYGSYHLVHLPQQASLIRRAFEALWKTHYHDSVAARRLVCGHFKTQVELSPPPALSLVSVPHGVRPLSCLPAILSIIGFAEQRLLSSPPVLARFTLTLAAQLGEKPSAGPAPPAPPAPPETTKGTAQQEEDPEGSFFTCLQQTLHSANYVGVVQLSACHVPWQQLGEQSWLALIQPLVHDNTVIRNQLMLTVLLPNATLPWTGPLASLLPLPSHLSRELAPQWMLQAPSSDTTSKTPISDIPLKRRRLSLPPGLSDHTGPQRQQTPSKTDDNKLTIVINPVKSSSRSSSPSSPTSSPSSSSFTSGLSSPPPFPSTLLSSEHHPLAATWLSPLSLYNASYALPPSTLPGLPPVPLQPTPAQRCTELSLPLTAETLQRRCSRLCKAIRRLPEKRPRLLQQACVFRDLAELHHCPSVLDVFVAVLYHMLSFLPEPQRALIQPTLTLLSTLIRTDGPIEEKDFPLWPVDAARIAKDPLSTVGKRGRKPGKTSGAKPGRPLGSTKKGGTKKSWLKRAGSATGEQAAELLPVGLPLEPDASDEVTITQPPTEASRAAAVQLPETVESRRSSKDNNLPAAAAHYVSKDNTLSTAPYASKDNTTLSTAPYASKDNTLSASATTHQRGVPVKRKSTTTASAPSSAFQQADAANSLARLRILSSAANQQLQAKRSSLGSLGVVPTTKVQVGMVPSAQAQPARQSDLPVHPAPAAVSSHRAHAHSYPLPAQVQQQQIVSAADTVVIPSRARAHSRSRPLPGVAQPPAGPPPPRQVGQVVHNADMAQQQGPLPRDQAALQTGQAAVPADPASVAAVRPAAPKPGARVSAFSVVRTSRTN